MAVYVTDTHPLLWYSTETYRKLSPKALRIFQKASRGEALIWIPAMVVWEAGLLEKIRRIQFRPSFSKWIDALAAQPGFAFAPLEFGYHHYRAGDQAQHRSLRYGNRCNRALQGSSFDHA